MNANLRGAARTLQASLEGYPWFQAVGIALIGGADALIVYVIWDDRQVRRHIPDSWEGYPVSPEEIGCVIP